MQEMWVWSLVKEDPLGKEMEAHSSILTWEIPWTEEPGALQTVGSQKSQQDLVSKKQWTDSTSDHIICPNPYLKPFHICESVL